MEDIRPIDLSGLKRSSLTERKSLVSINDFARAYKKGASFQEWIEGLPNILISKDLKEIAQRIAGARKEGRHVLLGMGAHSIKVGLSPLIVQLMEERVLTGIAMNGACIIHDTEIAMQGSTSEDVADSIRTGEFGMARETSEFLNRAIEMGYREGLGLGEAVTRAIYQARFPFERASILRNAHRLKVPVTVHVAIGTDIIHMDPMCNGRAIGESSLLDFRRFCTLVSQLEGGVYINLGSAVILPEVFLKAITVARNLGHALKDITTVSMDFIRHYRPHANVTTRPTSLGGRGYYLIGHHEVMLPLLAAYCLELIS